MLEVKCKRGEPIERALRRLHRKMDKENVTEEFKSREYYVKPSMKRRIAAGVVSGN